MVYHLLFDPGATLAVMAFMLLARLLLGPTYGQVYLSPPLGVGVALLLLATLNYPVLTKALRAPFPTDP